MKKTERKKPGAAPALLGILILAAILHLLSCVNPAGDSGKGAASYGTGKFLTGAGAPDASVGSDGDLFLDTVTASLYVKMSGAWSGIVTLKGDAGADGAAWYTGSTDPSASLGADGDFHLNTSTSVVVAKPAP